MLCPFPPDGTRYAHPVRLTPTRLRHGFLRSYTHHTYEYELMDERRERQKAEQEVAALRENLREVNTPKRKQDGWVDAITTQDAASLCLRYVDILTEWERKFCLDMSFYNSSLSERQGMCLNRAYHKIRNYALNNKDFRHG